MADRPSRLATSILAAITGAAAWCSAGTVAVTSGGADRVAALPPNPYLLAAMALAIVASLVVRLRLSDAWPLAISVLIFLPYLPGAVPAPFLLWQGPVELVVWTLVVVGLLATTSAPDLRGALIDPARAPWIAAAIIAAVALFAFGQLRSVVPNGDEPHYLVATQSLMGDRDLKVANNYAAGDYLQYFAGRLQPHYLQRSAAGEIYSIHSPGVSVIVLPAFAIAGYLGAVLTMIAISALAAALTWTVAWRVSSNAAAAWTGVIAVFLTAPMLFQSFTIYPDSAGALMVIGAVWLIVRLLDADDPGQPTLLVTGGGLALLPWLHTRFAILAASLGVAVIALLARRRLRPTRMAAFLTVPAVAAAAWFSYFWIIWGTPSPFAPYGRDMESSVSYIARGLAGLFFDQQHGVIATAPIFAIALIGMWRLTRERRALAVVLLCTAIPYVVAVSTYAMWWGGTSAPGRFVAAVLPLAAVLIALAWVSYPRLRTAMLLLLIISVMLVMPRLTEEDGRFVFNSRNAFDPTIEWLVHAVDLSLALPSLHRDAPAIALRDAVPWLLAVVAIAAASAAMARTGAGVGAQWAVVTWSGAAAVMAASAAVWMMQHAEPATPHRSTLAALSSHRSWHTTAIDLGQARRLPDAAYLSQLSIDAAADQAVALMRLRRIPAGEFEIASVDGASRALAANVNRNDPLIEAGSTPFRLTLPVALTSLSVRAEAPLPEGTPALRLTPVALTDALNSDGRAATRAARYGRARVFFFDETAYPEPGGFWTRAEGRATLVIDGDAAAEAGGLPVTITAGAAATTIGISVGEWSQSFSLTPGEKRETALPPLNGAAAWLVRIHSGPGFRPFQREPGSTDVRSLAAWFEIP